ncbi:MAG TPA: outer membrane lipoprotein-sorting protein [Acidobacteriaceae bacterium]|nr:outer membrane lipoprotein-sorting protein [Acidobacteriaceae bacterium]
MTQTKKFFAAAIFVAASVCAAGTPAPAADLQSVLAQMDASAVRFQDMQADISVDLYTAVVQEHRTQTGNTAFRRADGSMEMVTHILTDNGQPAVTDLLYKNGELDVYQPGVKQETILSAGNNRGEYDSMLATGFGATSKDLNAAWTVTFEGMESVNGVQAAKLDLVAKDEKVRDNFSHLTIWVDLSRDISLKQAMLQPSGDSRTVTYSNIRYNQHPAAKLFTLHVASGTQVSHK